MIQTLSVQDIANIAAVGAVVVPPVVSLLKREAWSAGVKQAIAGAISCVIALAALFAGHAISGAQFINSATIVQTITLVYAASQVAYRGFHGSTPDTWLTAFGSKSPPKPILPVSLVQGASPPT